MTLDVIELVWKGLRVRICPNQKALMNPAEVCSMNYEGCRTGGTGDVIGCGLVGVDSFGYDEVEVDTMLIAQLLNLCSRPKGCFQERRLVELSWLCSGMEIIRACRDQHVSVLA